MSSGTQQPRRTQAERAEETRGRLLDAAVAVLARDGYARTSTWAVCAEAKASRGALLHHFPTRLDLLSAAVDRMSAGVLAELDAALAGCPPDAMLNRFLDWLWRTLDGDFFAIGLELVTAARTEPALRARLRDGGDALGARLDAAIDRVAGRAPRARQEHVQAALHASVHMVRGIGLDLAIGGDRDTHAAKFVEWRRVIKDILSADHGLGSPISKRRKDGADGS